MKANLVALSMVAALLMVAGCQKAKDHSQEIKALENALKTLEGKIATLEKRVAKLSKEGPAKTLVHDVSADSVDETLAAFNEKLFEMEQILKAAGLDVLSTNEGIEASVVTGLVEEKALEIRREKYRTSMLATRDAQRKSDEKRYGQGITELQDKTSFRPGPGDRNMSQEDRQKLREERQAAREEILQKYPDSYAASQIKAEQTMRGIFENNYQGALESYKELMSSESGVEAVNDFGTRNATGLQYSLAQKAIEAGDYQTANQLISELESTSDDMVMAFDPPSQDGEQGGRGGRGGFGGSPRMEDNLVSKSQAISRLKESLNK